MRAYFVRVCVCVRQSIKLLSNWDVNIIKGRRMHALMKHVHTLHVYIDGMACAAMILTTKPNHPSFKQLRTYVC